MATLLKEEQKKIESFVESIQLQTGMSYPENSLIDIVKSLGVEVYLADLTKLGDDVSGVIQYPTDENGNSQAAIYININYPDTRKNFTLAHELGHYLLHPNETKFRIDKFEYKKDTKESKEESEANYFAACLLVPKQKLEKVLVILNADLDKVAKYFGVSRAVIETRLQWIRTN
jgi:Zn-dependent peptidase ImmA (M78 family)